MYEGFEQSSDVGGKGLLLDFKLSVCFYCFWLRRD